MDKERANIQEEIQNKFKKKVQQEKIKHSAIVNRCRMNKMQSRNQALMKIFSEVCRRS